MDISSFCFCNLQITGGNSKSKNKKKIDGKARGSGSGVRTDDDHHDRDADSDPDKGRHPDQCERKGEAVIGGCIFRVDDEVDGTPCQTNGLLVTKVGEARWRIEPDTRIYNDKKVKGYNKNRHNAAALKNGPREKDRSPIAVYAWGTVEVYLTDGEIIWTDHQIRGNLEVEATGDGKLKDQGTGKGKPRSWVSGVIKGKAKTEFLNSEGSPQAPKFAYKDKGVIRPKSVEMEGHKNRKFCNH